MNKIHRTVWNESRIHLFLTALKDIPSLRILGGVLAAAFTLIAALPVGGLTVGAMVGLAAVSSDAAHAVTVTTLAGNTIGYTDATGTSAQFASPSGGVVIVGNVYVADTSNFRVRKIDSSSAVTTFAGSTSGYLDGTGTGAKFQGFFGITADTAGNLYVADSPNNLIRKIDSSGVVSTLAGGGSVGGTASGSANGTGTAATFSSPRGIAVDAFGNVYVADYGNNLIRKIDTNGVVSTLAGGGSVGGVVSGSANGTGTAATFSGPTGVAVDASGNVYVADRFNNLIRKIDSSGVVSTLAGGAGATTSGYLDNTGTAAKFNNPTGVAVDSAGNVYVADFSNHRIRKITSVGVVTTVAGTGISTPVTNGDGTVATFNQPWGVALDATGNLYVADKSNNLIRKIAFTVAPSATTSAASSVGQTGATLNGTINDNGVATTVTFDYGTTTGYGTNVAATTGVTVSAGVGSTAAAVTLTGLTCNTTYHFRVNGVSSAGTTNGSDASFTTTACPVAGVCGSAHSSIFTTPPATNLCGDSSAPSVTSGNTDFTWTCAGSYGGGNDSCSATRNYVVSSSAGAGGGISASQQVAYSATPSFTVTPTSGYLIQSVTGCSGTLAAGTYTTAAITASCAVSASFVANVAPTFVGAITTLTVAQNASATDVKALLHASDSDASQTLTWSQSVAPTHGTLSISSATASTGVSGSADITPGGTITYTPTAGYSGPDSFTIQVSDGTASAPRSISVTVSAGTVSVNALTLNAMTAGTAFVSQSFSGAGGTGPYIHAVSAGTLPAGLVLNATTGALTGTPTASGAYSFTIRATDSSTGTGAPFSGTLAFTGTVLPATVTQTSIPTSSPGVTATLAATGCTGINSAVFVTAPAGAPANTTFPFGLLDFRLTGCSGSSVSVTVTYSQNLPANAVFYKENNGSYALYPTTAIGANSVTFNLTDGGQGDADGVADGNIHDPSGVGVTAAVAGAPTSIPTLSEWGMMFLSSLVAMFGMAQMRRRRVDR